MCGLGCACFVRFIKERNFEFPMNEKVLQVCHKWSRMCCEFHPFSTNHHSLSFLLCGPQASAIVPHLPSAATPIPSPLLIPPLLIQVEAACDFEWGSSLAGWEGGGKHFFNHDLTPALGGRGGQGGGVKKCQGGARERVNDGNKG